MLKHTYLSKILQQLGFRSGRKAMIIGNYAGQNLGDEAILQAILFDLDTILPRNDIFVPSRNPKAVSRIHAVWGVKMNPFAVFPKLLSSKYVVIGGGTIFSHYAGVFVYLLPAFLLIAKILRKKIIFYSIGFDQTVNLPLRLTSFLALLIADYVSVREHKSRENLNFVSRFKKIAIAHDPVINIYNLAPKKSVKQARNEAKQLSKQLEIPENSLAIATMPLKLPGFNSKFVREFPSIIEKYLEDAPDSKVFVLNFYLKRDSKFNAEWIDKLPPKVMSRVVVIDELLDPLTVLELIKHFKHFIAVRLHAKIFAHVTGRSYVPVCYAEKCTAFQELTNAPCYKPELLLSKDKILNLIIND